VLNRSKWIGIFIILILSQRVHGFDSIVVEGDDTSIYGISANPHLTSNKTKRGFARPDGKQIDRKKLDESAEKLNFDEKKKEDTTEPDRRQADLPEIKTFNPGELVKTIAFVLSIALLLSVLVYLILKTGKSTTVRREGRASAAEWEEAWNLDVEQAENLFDKAVGEGNFRLAIRLSYLSNLRLLIDRQLVKPSPEKTNKEYARELQSASLAPLFRQITRVYETVWYGEANPDRTAFDKVIPAFYEMQERAGKR
jgi:hypothetical protein